MRPTLHDIARQTGVSHMTVSRALRGSGRIDPRTQKRIVAAAQELGYRPNSAAQSVASGRFGCVTLLLGTVMGHSHLPEHLLSGIHDALWEVGMQLKFARLPDSALTDRARLPAVLTEWSCDGLLVDYTHDIPPAMVETIETGGLPAVWINTPRTTDCVRPDDEAMGRMATEHLLALGHGRIHYLDCSHPRAGLAQAHYSARAREAGYRAAIHAVGKAPHVFRPERDAESSARTATVTAALANAPTAVVAYSVPMELERYCIVHGLRVPEDLSVVAFGETAGHVLGRRGTFVPVPVDDVARQAVAVLLRKLRQASERIPAISVAPGGVVIGETTAAIPSLESPSRRTRNPSLRQTARHDPTIGGEPCDGSSLHPLPNASPAGGVKPQEDTMKTGYTLRRALAALLTIGTFTVNAATLRWTGGANPNWNNAANWIVSSGSDADGIPDADDTVEFYQTASNLATVNDRAAGSSAVATLSGLLFLGTADSTVSIGGNAISFGSGNSGITVQSGAANPTIAAGITTTTGVGLGINVVGASQVLTTAGTLNSSGVGTTLNLNGSGTVRAASTLGGSGFNMILDIDAGTLDLQGGNGSINRLVGSGGTLTNSGATTRILTTINSAANATNDTVIGGNLNVAIGRNNFFDAGDRVQTFSANNTYTGTTTVSTGTLLINGITSGQGNYIVNGRTLATAGGTAMAGTLAGTGWIGLANHATVAANYVPINSVTGTALATITAGVTNQAATLTMGTPGNNNAVIFGGATGQGGRLLVEVGASGASDRIVVHGALDFSATNDRLQLSALAGAFDGSTYTIATHTGARTGKFASVFLDATDITAIAEVGFVVGSKTYRLVYGANTVRLEVPVAGTLIVIR